MCIPKINPTSKRITTCLLNYGVCNGVSREAWTRKVSKEASDKLSHLFFAILVYRGKQHYGGGGGPGASKRDRPPPSPQPGKLIVRGYPEGTNDDELRALFERFGKLEEGV